MPHSIHIYTVFYPIFHDFYRIDTQSPNDQIKLSKNLNQLIARQGTRDAQDCGTKMSSVMRWVISLTTEVRPGLGQHFISRNYLNNLWPRNVDPGDNYPSVPKVMVASDIHLNFSETFRNTDGNSPCLLYTDNKPSGYKSTLQFNLLYKQQEYKFAGVDISMKTVYIEERWK